MSDGMSGIVKYMKSDVITQKVEEILGKNSGGFVSSALQVISDNYLLRDATPESVYTGIMASAAMGLSLNKNLGHAHLVPYKNNRKNCTEAQFQIGWKGLMQLAIRSNKYRTANAVSVSKNQFGGKNYMTGEIQFNNVAPEGGVVGYLAYFELKNGFVKWLYMSNDEMEEHAKKYSQAYRYDLKEKKKTSNWSSNRDSMGMKTVLKLLLSRYGILSIDMEKAIEMDQAVITEDETVIYPDNEKIPEPTPEEKKKLLKDGETKAPVMP